MVLHVILLHVLLSALSFADPPSFPPVSHPQVGGLGLLFEVDLWRSDLLTTVLETDVHGNLLMGGLTNPLSPPGAQG